MNAVIVQSSGGITLVGGGPVSASLFRFATQRAPLVVAADGGADRCLALGTRPKAVIGDMDSISAAARAAIGEDRLHLIAEQVSTDFEKALGAVQAPFVLAVGFAGARIDHGLAVLGALAQQHRPVILLGPQDAVFHLPLTLDLALRRGDRFSLFPMQQVTGTSTGLDWPIDGLTFAPAGRIGTSNRVSSGPVSLRMAGPGMLCILPRRRLDQVLVALGTAPFAETRSR